jgi:hypothetical protein
MNDPSEVCIFDSIFILIKKSKNNDTQHNELTAYVTILFVLKVAKP